MRPFVATMLALAVVGAASCAGSKPPVAPKAPADTTRLVSLEVSMSRMQIDVGDKVGAIATGYDEHGGRLQPADITWASTSPVVATVSATGQVTGVAPGSTTITATKDALTASALVLVAAPNPGAQADVSPASAIVQRNGTLQLTAVLRDGGGAVVTPQQSVWTSADVGIATVTNAGLVTAREEGTVTVSVLLDGHSSYATIKVTPVLSAIISVHVLAPDTTAEVVDSVKIIAAVSPERPLTKVIGHVGARPFTMRAIRIGPLGGAEAWEAWVKVSDMTVGYYYAAVTVYDKNDATASDSVRFKRKLTSDGAGVGTPGLKIILPP